MEITIEDDVCWICGKHKGIVGPMTEHHALPKHLKPKKNVKLPACQGCHDDLNQEDHKGIMAFAFKIDRSFQELGQMVKNMTKNLKRGK